MAWLPRGGVVACAIVALAAALTLANPSPPDANANVACDIGSAVTPITGAVGIGNPAGDACNGATDAVSGMLPDPLSPIKDAAKSIGSGIFNQITSWAADGAVWLLGRVAALTTRTTSPNLLSKGFLRQYRQMVSIAAVLAILMLIFACLEGLGRSDGGMLWRVFLVNVPVAALATSAAYVVVQLLIATTDGFSEVVAHSTASDLHDFFKSAIESLAVAGAKAGTTTGGPGAGTAVGAEAVPLFVGFIAAIVAAFAAFLVWIELLMRDAAIYAVALFMPLAIAASIWPRWMGALRRTGELVIVVVFSKFVIVSVIALAASLLANTGGKVEHVLAAGALMLLACFAPFVLFRLVPFAEGAVSSAFSRQSAGSASLRTVQFTSSVQMMRRAALANWAVNSTKGKDGSAAGGGGGGSAGGGGAKAKPGGGSGGGGGGADAGQAAGASGGAAGAVALPVAVGVGAAKGSQTVAGKLASSGTSHASGASGGTESGGAAQGGSREAAARPPAEQGAGGGGKAAAKADGEGEGGNGAPSSSKTSSAPPEPREASGGEAGRSGAKRPRPAGDVGAADKGGGAAGTAKP